ncbi:copper-binding protein (NosD) [Halogranum amylolyticum]|uniref:Copper-binding protein (NosD) n=1 Tax=Halogranum amylolyticum TaxID=660520 RepID=A0A1H8VT81_9EURY|nr:NosD domain-containing protein [Halogranum amylolyticum]SEP18500.1 copper-binding protein (NosD) [Halogranum amylolyticum]
MEEKRLTSRTTITKPGTYRLAKDIQNGGGTRLSEACIRIEANDVVLDGAGRTIGGNGVSDTSGIIVSNARNVTIKNVTVEQWDYGIRFESTFGGQIRDVRVVNNGYGISFADTDLVVLRGSIVSNNLLGTVSDAASTLLVWNNTITKNSRDVYRSSSQHE